MERWCHARLNLILPVSSEIRDWNIGPGTGILMTHSLHCVAALKSTFAEEPLDTWVVAGQEVRLPCTPPTGHPPPELEWRKNGDMVESGSGDGRMVVDGSHNLIISSAQQSDEGRYQCIARNMAGVRHSTQALLSVYGE